MIAKHVPMKSVRKSDFAGLVKYLIDEQQKRERVTGVSVTNCHADRPDAAILEVLNTQAQNRRAESDKTYHLIVSFRAGEQPDAATLQAIEKSALAARQARQRATQLLDAAKRAVEIAIIETHGIGVEKVGNGNGRMVVHHSRSMMVTLACPPPSHMVCRP